MQDNIKAKDYEVKIKSPNSKKTDRTKAGKFTSRSKGSNISASTKFSQLPKDSIQPWLTLKYDREVNKFLPETGLGIPAPPIKPMFKSYIITMTCMVMVVLMILIPIIMNGMFESFETKFWMVIIFELLVASICITVMASVYNRWKRKRDLWEQDINQLV